MTITILAGLTAGTPPAGRRPLIVLGWWRGSGGSFDERNGIMISLNHTIVPARDKVAAARFFADIFGLPFDATSGHFALVRANDNWTFLRGKDSHHTRR